MKTLQLQVPCSTSNLGPGFDCLGLALNLYLKANITPAKEWGFDYSNSSYDILPKGKNNLIAESYLEVCKQHQWIPQSYFVEIEADIPLRGGLGSSSTALVCGVTMAYVYHATEAWSVWDIFVTCADIEGHPDNVAPAILGGAQYCGKKNGLWFSETLPFHPDLQLITITPDSKASTKEMRGLLPTSYSNDILARQEKIVQRVIQGMATADPLLLQASMEDEQHQPFRFKILKESSAIYHALPTFEGVISSFLSGSGPTIAAFATKDINIEEIKKQYPNAITRALQPEAKGLVWEEN